MHTDGSMHMPDSDPARPMVLANPATRCLVDASPRRSRPTLRTPAVAAPPTYPSETVIAMQNSDLHQDGTLKIGAVSRLTGLSTHTLRKWESRYGVVDPGRSNGG